MPRRKLKTQARKPRPQPAYREDAPTLQVQNPHAAGIDVHSDNHVVCVGPGRVETFGAYTADLHAIADYLRQAGVTTVALESTGVYWVPLLEHLGAKGSTATSSSRANCAAAAPGPRPTCWTASGCSGCTPTAC